MAATPSTNFIAIFLALSLSAVQLAGRSPGPGAELSKRTPHQPGIGNNKDGAKSALSPGSHIVRYALWRVFNRPHCTPFVNQAAS